MKNAKSSNKLDARAVISQLRISRQRGVPFARAMKTTWNCNRFLDDVNSTEGKSNPLVCRISHAITRFLMEHECRPEDMLSYACSCVGRCEALLLLPNSSLGRGWIVRLCWNGYTKGFSWKMCRAQHKKERTFVLIEVEMEIACLLYDAQHSQSWLHWVDVCGILPCSGGAVLSSQTTRSLRKLRQIGWKEHIFMKLNESRKLPLNAAKLNEIRWWKLTRERFFLIKKFKL